MTREEAEVAFDQALAHLRVSVKAGELGIFTPDSLQALLRSGQSMLRTLSEPDGRDAFITGLLARANAEPESAPVIDLFTKQPVGQS